MHALQGEGSPLQQKWEVLCRRIAGGRFVDGRKADPKSGFPPADHRLQRCFAVLQVFVTCLLIACDALLCFCGRAEEVRREREWFVGISLLFDSRQDAGASPFARQLALVCATDAFINSNNVPVQAFKSWFEAKFDTVLSGTTLEGIFMMHDATRDSLYVEMSRNDLAGS